MTTPTQHLEIFESLAKDYADKSYLHSEENYPEQDKVDALDNLKQHLIQTVISVLEEERSKIEELHDGENWDGITTALTSIERTLSTWQALL